MRKSEVNDSDRTPASGGDAGNAAEPDTRYEMLLGAFRAPKQMDQYSPTAPMHKVGKIGPEVERITRQGAIAPDLWMRGATGAPVGPDALLSSTEQALRQVAGR